MYPWKYKELKKYESELEFIRCGKYDYCKITKELKDIIDFLKR